MPTSLHTWPVSIHKRILKDFSQKEYLMRKASPMQSASKPYPDSIKVSSDSVLTDLLHILETNGINTHAQTQININRTCQKEGMSQRFSLLWNRFPIHVHPCIYSRKTWISGWGAKISLVCHPCLSER